MRFSDLKFKKTLSPKGVSAVVNFGNYDLSIIQNEMSYGNKSGLYEIGVMKGREMVSMPGITEDYDSVKGYLTEEDVSGILLKMHTLTATQGTQ